ncbi:hypothetical protein ATY41_08440 [Leifsonia xyli subsp. xyli]|uniref:Acyltransferase 3 domain-containing protein n=1 Tax=Leifsonia xyli subsp. xyli TaxID=59736 RepID=A0A1E2SM48_LEIXY|nr:acyltransferase [Leifsonia xyli]ODA90800.1 hypothetical protein ATY41_08440 [Leifsonia xyli subsp. xyli]
MRTWFRPDIEGLRALAVLVVVANHAWRFPTGGYVGVDIFFVISGYLITRALLREKEYKGAISLGRFYTRRFARLAPAAIATIAVTVAMSNLLFFGVTNASWNQQAFTSLLWVQNWNLVHARTVYLDANASVSLFQHFWSLSVEEQFYAFWPWVLILAWAAVAVWAAVAKRRPPHLRSTVLVVGVLGFAASLAFSIWLTDSRPASAYFATPTRVWEFAAGVIAAAGFAGVSRRVPAKALRAAGLAAILISAVLFDTTTPFPGAAALLPVLGTVVVIVAAERAATDRDYGRVLTLAPVRYIGRISYSLYLWHAPVIVFAAALFPGEGFVHGLLCVAASVAIAALSYYVIEQPAWQAAVWKRLGAWLSERGNRARLGDYPWRLCWWLSCLSASSAESNCSRSPLRRPPPRPPGLPPKNLRRRWPSPRSGTPGGRSRPNSPHRSSPSISRVACATRCRWLRAIVRTSGSPASRRATENAGRPPSSATRSR